MKKVNVYCMILVMLCLAIPFLTMAQGPVDPEDTPIDGGLSVLLAAGAAYGVKKYRNSMKSRGEEKVK